MLLQFLSSFNGVFTNLILTSKIKFDFFFFKKKGFRMSILLNLLIFHYYCSDDSNILFSITSAIFWLEFCISFLIGNFIYFCSWKEDEGGPPKFKVKWMVDIDNFCDFVPSFGRLA